MHSLTKSVQTVHDLPLTLRRSVYDILAFLVAKTSQNCTSANSPQKQILSSDFPHFCFFPPSRPISFSFDFVPLQDEVWSSSLWQCLFRFFGLLNLEIPSSSKNFRLIFKNLFFQIKYPLGHSIGLGLLAINSVFCLVAKSLMTRRQTLGTKDFVCIFPINGVLVHGSFSPVSLSSPGLIKSSGVSASSPEQNSSPLSHLKFSQKKTRIHCADGPQKNVGVGSLRWRLGYPRVAWHDINRDQKKAQQLLYLAPCFSLISKSGKKMVYFRMTKSSSQSDKTVSSGASRKAITDM